MSVEDLIQNYLAKSAKGRAKMQSRLFTIFTETTGYRPEDLCLVEQQIVNGLEYKTVFYFDWKHRHTTVAVTSTEPAASIEKGGRG